MKILNKSIIYCQTLSVDRSLTYIVKILCHTSLPSFLTWVCLAIFCFRRMPNGNCQFSSVSVELLCKWRTHYAQYSALISVYLWKKQSVQVISYFSPIEQCLNYYRVFKIPKQVIWIAPMRHLSRKKHWIIRQDKVFASFLCVLSLSSVLGRHL